MPSNPLDLSGYYPSSTGDMGRTGRGSKKRNPLDLSGYVDPAQIERGQNRDAELAAKVDAIAQDFASRGETLSDSDIASLWEALNKGEDWTRPVDFSGVSASIDTTAGPATEERTGLAGYLTDTKDYAVNTYKAAVAQEELADIQDEEGKGLVGSLMANYTELTGAAEALRALSGTDVSGYDISGAATATADELTAGISGASGLAAPFLLAQNFLDPHKAKQRLAAEREARDARKLSATAQLEEASTALQLLSPDPVTETVVGAVSSAAGQPEQILPTVGAVAGGILGGAPGAATGGALLSIPMAQTAYIQAKDEALREFDATEEEADRYGLAVAAIQVGSEAVGGPLESMALGVAKRFGLKSLTKDAAQEAVFGRIRGTASRVAGGAVVEGAEEVAATAGQDALQNGLEASEFFSSPEGQAALKENNLENAATWGERYAQSFGAGATVGGVISAPVAATAVAAEKSGRRTSLEDTITSTLDSEQQALTARDTAVQGAEVKDDTLLNQDIALEERRIANEEAQRAAFEQAEKESAEQRELEEEAGFQTLERGEVGTTSRLERYAGVVERVPVNPAREVRPEDVAEQRATEQRTAAEQAERVRRGKLTETLRKEQERRAKAAEKAEKNKSRSQRLAEDKRARDIAGQILDENPDTSPDELTDELERRLAQPVEEVDDVEVKAANVIKRVEASTKATATRAETDKIKNLVRRNPDATPAQIAELYRGAAPTPTPVTPVEAPAATVVPVPTKSDKSMAQAELDKLVDGMGLNNESLGMAAQSTEANGDFRTKAKTFVKALVNRGSRQDSTDVQNLVRQGKIIVAPNAAAIGRDGTVARAGEYDMDTGKTYLYLDNMGDMSDAVGHIATAIHEVNHALLTPEQIGAAATKLRAAAKSGNKYAKQALADAQADTAARAGDTTYEDEELVAYFANRTKEAERGVLGSVGGIVRDITSNAKQAIRDTTGLDLEVTPGNIATALHAATGDAVNREIAGRGNAGSLGMIVGPSSTGFARAQAQGKTYTGARDFGERLEIPDNEAEVTSNQATLDKLAEGETVYLGDLLQHPNLYAAYPGVLSNMPVRINNDMSAGAYGQFTGDSIDVSAAHAVTAKSGNKEFLRTLLLHETQHAIQAIEGFVPGANATNFMSRSARVRLERAQENYLKFIRNFDLGRAEQTLTPQVKGVWNNEITANDIVSRDAKAALFLTKKYYEDSTDRSVKIYGPKFEDVKESLDIAQDEYRQAEREAFQTYLRDYGETEARNTEFRSRMTNEELEASTPETTMGDAPYNIPVERTLDTTPYVGGVRKPPQALGMAASSPERTQQRRDAAVVDFLLPERWQDSAQKARTILTNLFRNDKGVGAELRNAYEHAKSSPAGEEARANASFSKYHDALNKQAAEQGITAEQLNSAIMEDLDAIDKTSDSYDQNLAAYKAITAKHGNAGRHLLDLRNQVDALTLEMLTLRAQARNKPVGEERKVLRTLASNMGRYSHRLYAAHQGKAGKKYAEAIMDVYNKGKKGKPLTPQQKDTYEMVRRALKVLIDDSLFIPDDDAMAERGGDSVTRLYKTWGSQPAGSLTVDQMRDELASIRDRINGDTQRLEDTAEKIASDLIGLTETDQPIATYFRGGKQDRGILQEQAKLPAEIRALMGEITDAGTKLLATVAKQAEFVARTKFLLEVQNNANPNDLQPPEAEGTPAVLNNRMVKLNGEGYGPLNGWFVSSNLNSMLSDVRESIANFEQVSAMSSSDPTRLTTATVEYALEKWMTLAGVSKRLQIVGNLFLYPLNFFGATFAPLMNGNISLITYGQGLNDAVRLIRYARQPGAGLGKSEDAVRYGVTDSATVGELKGLPYEKIQKFVAEMAGKKPSTALAVARGVGLTLQETYAMMDVWAKISNFHNEVGQLTSYYKKNNESRTEEQIKREAADIVNKTNITYKRALPLMRAVERGGITNFGTYFYEVFRSQIGNVAQGLKEVTTDVAAADTASAKAAKLSRGVTRLGGQMAYWAFLQQVTATLSALMFGDDEDEWDKRALYPEYMQNQDLFPVGFDKHGNPVAFSVSRIDAIGPITDIMRQAMTGGMSFEQAGDEFLNLYVKPRLVPQLIGLTDTLVNDKTPTKKPIVQQLTPNGFEAGLKAADALNIDDKSIIAWTNVAEAAFLPGTFNAYRDSNPTITSAMPEGDSVMQVSNALRYAGATFVKMNPDSAVYFANKDYEDTVKAGRTDLADMFKNRPNITDQEIVEFVNEARAAEHKQWLKLARVYRGMEAYDMRQSDIGAILKDTGLDKATISSINEQKFKSQVVSEKSFDARLKKQLIDKTAEEKEEIEKSWKEAWERLELTEETE